MAAKPEGNSKVEEEAHEPSPTTKADAPQPKLDDDDDDHHHHHQQSSANEPRSSSSSEEDTKQWGTHVMGPPAIPVVHPDNQKAALWVAGDHQQIHELPYLVYTPAEKPTQNSFELVINVFNTWSRKAETVARSVWHNRGRGFECAEAHYPSIYELKRSYGSGSSVSDAAWGKVNLTAKAITKGGFDSLFKKIFATDPNEKLKKAFACYLSTTTGPVAGTLYLSTARVAFCSDRPLSFVAPSGQETWTYYKGGLIALLRGIDSFGKNFQSFIRWVIDMTLNNYKYCPRTQVLSLNSTENLEGFVTQSMYSRSVNLQGLEGVMIPLSDIATVYPVVMKENPASESYIEVVTVDGHDFWFMGFVKFEKASLELLNNVLDFNATTEPVAA
ncbi:hypothetical protein Godav_018640 [Gossypium davidsonii]|uniref:GRAM domain-containing protein n=1 Tax=Gossypium davidsonii TaxID=34287 RepID=A0A7J8QX29_GOSDV|nr:hypothetical protein [Gossypium davidsonii]